MRRQNDRSEIELSLITPEPEPLEIFGKPASSGIRRLLDNSGVTLYTSRYGAPSRPGWLDVSPGERGMPVDRGRHHPPPGRRSAAWHPLRPRRVHQHRQPRRLPRLDDVFAAGDATTFPIKQGGLAAQQADAVAEAIAASVGADIDPQPFRPVLRGVLLRQVTPLPARRRQRCGER